MGTASAGCTAVVLEVTTCAAVAAGAAGNAAAAGIIINSGPINIEAIPGSQQRYHRAN